MLDLNEIYFKLLLDKYKKNESQSLVINEPGKKESNIICLPIATKSDLESIDIQKYEDLSEEISLELKNYNYTLIKMQAGLGSSVKRDDLISKLQGRTKLGSKGTDLFFKVEGEYKSIAEIQVLQANALSKKNIYKRVNYQNLVNDETHEIVCKSSNLVSLGDSCSLKKEYFQEKMPTLNKDGELTFERVAPAGHGFLGICEIVNIFENDVDAEIVAIGNGEDLSSTPDPKITGWVVDNNIPIAMITTTKTPLDTKGGQISIVKGKDNACSTVTIVEKAQAEESGQLEYFEQLGLRDGDQESLFNTNIVLINKKALKKKFETHISGLSLKEFLDKFSPDVIRNTKEQDGQFFTQLESALGSVVLNLDKLFRQEFHTPLVSFLNLGVESRKDFFMPIKKRDDYEEICSHFCVDHISYRLVPLLKK